MEGLYFASGVDQNFVKDINKMMASMDALKNKTVKGTAQMEDSFSKLQKRALQLFSGVALTSFIKQTIEVRNEFENLTNAFTVMLKSREKAQSLMKETVTTAATTPFSVLDIANSSKQLIAFGEESDTVIGTIRRLGDVASATGSNLGEVTAVYGKVMGKGKLELEQLNSLTERGINVLPELAKMHDTNTAGILKMVSQGKIGFADLQQSIFNLTAEGGKFYNMMQTQSATVSGMMSNLSDQYDSMLNEIGQSQTTTITTTIKLLSTLLDHWEAIASAIGVAVVAYGSYRTVVLTMSAFNEAKLIMDTVKSLGLLRTVLGGATTAQGGLNVAMSMNPMGAIVAVISALVAGLVIFVDWTSESEKQLKKLAEESDESNKKIAKSFEDLRKRLNKANLTDSDVLNIKKEMILLYPKELEHIKDQKLTASQLLDIWEKIKKTHQDLGNIDINNNAIKELEAKAKHLENIAKGLVKDDVTGIMDFGGQTINGVQVSQRVIDEYENVKKALEELYLKNEELNKNADDDAQKRLDDAEKERQKKISELQKTNELEYQLALNHANKMYGSEVDNKEKLADAIYRIELVNIEKQLKAIDDMNKGKMTKELELQKAQLNAKKIGLINQQKLDTDAKIKKDRLDNLTEKYAFVDKLNTIEQRRSRYTSGVTPYTITNTEKEQEIYKFNKPESLLTNEAKLLKNENIFERNILELKNQQLKEELEIYETLKNKSAEDEKRIKNIKEELKLNELITKDLENRGEYSSKLLNENKTIAQKIKDFYQLFDYNIQTFKNDTVEKELKKELELREEINKLNEEEAELKKIIYKQAYKSGVDGYGNEYAMSAMVEDEEANKERIKKLEEINKKIGEVYLLKYSTTESPETTAYRNFLKNQEDIRKNIINNITKDTIESSTAINNLKDDINDVDEAIDLLFDNDEDRKTILYNVDLSIENYENKIKEAKKVLDEYELSSLLEGKLNSVTALNPTHDTATVTSNEYYEALRTIELLEKEIKKLTETSKKFKLEIASEDIKNLESINSELFKTLDLLKSTDESNLNNFVDTISKASTSVFQLADIVQKLKESTSALQTAGLYMAGVGVAISFMVALDEAQQQAEANRDKALANELKMNYDITDQKIKQLALYKEGNEFYASDNFGSTLASLDAYNQSLTNQNDLLLEIKNNAGVTDYDKGIVNFMRSEKQDRGEAKDEALQQSTLNKQALASIEIRTKERSKLGSAIGLKDKYSDVLSLYPQVVSANDQINYGILENIIATEDLSDADKQRLQNLVDNNKLAIESYSKFGEYISGIFGDVGESITSSFQDAYENFDNFADAGIEAMKSLEQAMSDMIENMTNDVIENAILQPLINQLNTVNKALGEEYAKSNKTDADASTLQNGILNSLGTFYSQINESQGLILDTYKKADEMAKQAGFDSVFNKDGDTTATDTSGSGNIIGASISQETSNELMGRVSGIYLNSEHMLKIQRDASDYAIKNNLYLSNISANSNYLISIDERLKKMNEKL